MKIIIERRKTKRENCIWLIVLEFLQIFLVATGDDSKN